MILGVKNTMVIWHVTLHIHKSIHTYICIYVYGGHMYIARIDWYESRCRENDDNLAYYPVYTHIHTHIYVYINVCMYGVYMYTVNTS